MHFSVVAALGINTPKHFYQSYYYVNNCKFYYELPIFHHWQTLFPLLFE